MAAGSSTDWNIRYVKGAPSSDNIETCTRSVNYYSGGYDINVKSWDATFGAEIRVTPSTSGGWKGAGTYRSVSGVKTYSGWKLEKASDSAVRFTFKAVSSGRCFSNGVIKISK